MRTRQFPWAPASLVSPSGEVELELLEAYAGADAEMHRAASVAIAGRRDLTYPARVLTLIYGDISCSAKRVHLTALGLMSKRGGILGESAKCALCELGAQRNDAFVQREALAVLCSLGLLGALTLAPSPRDRMDDIRPIDWTLTIAARRGARAMTQGE